MAKPRSGIGEAAWTALAILGGIGVVFLPLPFSIALFVFVGFALLFSFTPLTVFIVLLTLAPMRALMAAESPLQLPLDIGQLFLLLLFAVWIAHRIVQRQRLLSIAASPVFIPVIGFVIALSVSAVSAVSLGAWLAEWLKWIQVLLVIALVLGVGEGRKWEVLLAGIVLAGAANAVVGLYIFMGGSGADHLIIGELSGSQLLSIFSEQFFRAFGTFGQPNPFGAFMGLTAPVALMAALGYAVRTWQFRRIQQRWSLANMLLTAFYTVSAFMISAALIASWSRGAWLGFAIAMLALIFALPRRLIHSVLLIAVIAAVSAALWASGRLPASIVDRIASATQETFAFDDVRGVDITPANYAVVERLAHWQAALNMVRSSPFIGVGAGNYEVAYAQHRLINWREPLGHAHNYYLNIFAEAGMIGLVSYLALWLSVFWLTWRTRRHPDALARSIAVGLLGTWTYLMVHSLTDNLYVNNVFIHIGLMLGILALLYRQVYTCKKLALP